MTDLPRYYGGLLSTLDDDGTPTMLHGKWMTFEDVSLRLQQLEWGQKWAEMIQAFAHDETLTDSKFRNIARWIAIDQTLSEKDIARAQEIDRMIELRESRSPDGDGHRKCEDDGVTTGVRDRACSSSSEEGAEGEISRRERPAHCGVTADLDEESALTAEGSIAWSEQADSLQLHARVAQLEQEKATLLSALKEVERHCPCGARPETPKTHPHVSGCPVGYALESLTHVA